MDRYRSGLKSTCGQLDGLPEMELQTFRISGAILVLTGQAGGPCAVGGQVALYPFLVQAESDVAWWVSTALILIPYIILRNGPVVSLF